MCWRVNSPSAMVLMPRAYPFEANAEESARFERARRAARTSCDGLFDGHKFDSTAGSTEADWRGRRKAGPPII